MDSRLYITDEGRWDSLRLHDIQPTTDTTIGREAFTYPYGGLLLIKLHEHS